jgi:UrcA family protein
LRLAAANGRNCGRFALLRYGTEARRGRLYNRLYSKEPNMALNKFFLTGTAVVLGLFTGGIAQAQDSRERIIVTPPIAKYENPMPLKGGLKTQTLMVNRMVRYGDLDLSKRADRATLNRRITFAADRACAELDAKFPQTVYVPVDDPKTCVNHARRQALAMVDFRYQPELSE